MTCYRADLSGRTIAEAVVARGKELSVDDTVATARRLLESRPVQVLPVLAGGVYLGAVDRETVAGHVPDCAAVGPLAGPLLVTATASTPAVDALAALDRNGGRRLVVLGDDGETYVGLVCMRRDRRRVCVDASIAPPRRTRTERIIAS